MCRAGDADKVRRAATALRGAGSQMPAQRRAELSSVVRRGLRAWRVLEGGGGEGAGAEPEGDVAAPDLTQVRRREAERRFYMLRQQHAALRSCVVDCAWLGLLAWG